MRNIDDLKANALKFWPSELSDQEKTASVIPFLIDSQDKFISLLNVADSSPDAWKSVVSVSKGMPANLFLKHLMVLSDIGGERLMRFKTELHSLFPENKMNFSLDGKNYEYQFQTLTESISWNNKSLKVDGDNLSNPCDVFPALEDVVMLLMFGGSSLSDTIPAEIQEKCILGGMLGRKAELDTFVRQRYIFVSRITGGATANAMGHLAQNYVIEILKDKLADWDFSKKNIPGISQNDGRTPIAFDIVAISSNNRYCAIEVSFQVTTNSTIERKAGQARSRQSQLHDAGHKIAYVIDGAGNFQRISALSTICQYSDCTVSFKDEELFHLVDFLKKTAEK